MIGLMQFFPISFADNASVADLVSSTMAQDGGVSSSDGRGYSTSAGSPDVTDQSGNTAATIGGGTVTAGGTNANDGAGGSSGLNLNAGYRFDDDSGAVNSRFGGGSGLVDDPEDAEDGFLDIKGGFDAIDYSLISGALELKIDYDQTGLDGNPTTAVADTTRSIDTVLNFFNVHYTDIRIPQTWGGVNVALTPTLNRFASFLKVRLSIGQSLFNDFSVGAPIVQNEKGAYFGNFQFTTTAGAGSTTFKSNEVGEAAFLRFAQNPSLINLSSAFQVQPSNTVSVGKGVILFFRDNDRGGSVSPALVENVDASAIEFKVKPTFTF